VLVWAALCLLPGTRPAGAADAPTCAGGPRPDLAAEDLRSPPSPDGPTEVRAGLFVEDLRDLNAMTASYRIRGVVTATWCDPRLAFDPGQAATREKVYFGDEAVAQIQRLFTARGFIVNQVEEPRITERVVRVGSDGTVSTDFNISALLSAVYDLRRFPFDRQRLEVEIESYLWNANQVVFAPDDSLTGFAEDFDIPEWTITGVRADVGSVQVIRSAEPCSAAMMWASVVLPSPGGP
jgi:hypothetical protein